MRTVVSAWAFCLLTGLLVSIVLPLGEGFDEPWHLGYVQYVADTGRLPPGPSLHLSSELETFLTIHPIGWRLNDIFPGLHTQEQYWQQDPSQRALDDNHIRALRFSSGYESGQAAFSQQYESHQPPLYYALTAPLFWLAARFLSLAGTFMLTRLWSMLLASAIVPLAWLLAERVCHSRPVSNAVAVLIALFPGLYPDVARVSNDALAVPLAAAVFVALTQYADSRTNRNAVILGLLLLAGMLTKAFFIPVLLAIVVALLLMREFRAVLTIAAVSAAGWIWYVHNLASTGSVTGLPETVAAKTTVTSSIGSLARIRWLDVLHLAAVSHIWMGNWSLLQYRGWIYRIVITFFAAGVAGFIVYLWKTGSRPLLTMVWIYVVYAAALAYYATQVFQQTGTSVIQGWYLTPLISIEALVFVLGIGCLCSGRIRAGVFAFAATCFLGMGIYGNLFVAAPYYTGLTDHAPSGNLRAYHPRWPDIATMSERLTRFMPGLPAGLPVIVSAAVILTGFFLIWSVWQDRSL